MKRWRPRAIQYVKLAMVSASCSVNDYNSIYMYLHVSVMSPLEFRNSEKCSEHKIEIAEFSYAYINLLRKLN